MNDEKRDEARVPLVDFRIIDVEKYAEYAHEMHQFMRQKAHETQTHKTRCDYFDLYALGQATVKGEQEIAQ